MTFHSHQPVCARDSN